MRFLYFVISAVSVAQLPARAATIPNVDNALQARQIHSADFSSNVTPSTSIDVTQDKPISASGSTPPLNVAAKEGDKRIDGSSKFAKRDSNYPVALLSSSGDDSKGFYDSSVSEGPLDMDFVLGNKDSKSLAALKRFIVSDIVEKMPPRGREMSLPSGVNSHTVDPSTIPSYVGLESPPDSVQSVIEKHQALSQMVSRGIELPEFFRPHSINFAARSEDDDGTCDGDEDSEGGDSPEGKDDADKNDDGGSGTDDEDDGSAGNDDDDSDGNEEEQNSEDNDPKDGDEDDSDLGDEEDSVDEEER